MRIDLVAPNRFEIGLYGSPDPPVLEKKEGGSGITLVPRPGRRRKYLQFARACANYPKKFWGATNDYTLFCSPLEPRV